MTKIISGLNGKRWMALGALVLCGMSMTSCSVSLPTRPIAEQKNAPELYKWWGDDMKGTPAVKISLNEQKAHIYRGGEEAGWTMLATGKPGHPTPTGSFTVMEKIQDKRSNTYGYIADKDGNVVNGDAMAGVTPVPAGCRYVAAPMPYWMRLTSYGVGMHEGEIPDPGLPASHGCIRMPREMAQKLFEIVSVGTSVTISGSAPQS